MPPASSPTLLHVLGDEELLATRAVNDAVAAIRASDPDVEVRVRAAADIAATVLVTRALAAGARSILPGWWVTVAG